jgi:hypothetical protein
MRSLTKGLSTAATISPWEWGARASPMSWSSAAATYSLSFPARSARVADCKECSSRVTLSAPWNRSSSATAFINLPGSSRASSSASALIS